jgi:hypothetical protein
VDPAAVADRIFSLEAPMRVGVFFDFFMLTNSSSVGFTGHFSVLSILVINNWWRSMDAEIKSGGFSGRSSALFIRRLFIDSFFIVILPNIFFFVTANYFSLNRSLINFDYVIVIFLFLLGWRFVGLIAVAIAFFFDILFLLGQILPVLRISDVFYLFGFIGVTPVAYQILFAIGAAVLLFSVVGLMRFSRRGIEVPTMVVINAVVFIYISTLFLGTESNNSIWRVTEVSLVSSLTVLNLDLRRAGFIENFNVDPKPLSPAAYVGKTQAWLAKPIEIPDKVLLILSESWGVTDKPIRDALLKPFEGIRQGVNDYQAGTLEFSGVTVEAELRELCGLTTSHFNLSKVESGFERCLPNLLKESGYKTVGIHGAVGLMYDRALWYPRAGFEQTLFFETQEWDRRCYSFPGACDFEIAAGLSEMFADESRVFLYWLTLNSHAFYDERDIVYDVFDCGIHGIPLESQTCRNLKLHAQYFFRLAEALSAPEFDGFSVLIVGDHSPPIMNREEKMAYFKDDSVPWVSFEVGQSAEEDDVAR